MNRYLKIGLAAAAVVVIALVGSNLLLGSPAPGGEPSLTPEPSVVEPSVAQPSSRPAGVLPEGSHLLHDIQTFGAQIIVTIPGPDWYGERDGGVLVKNDNPNAPDGAGLIVFAETNDLLVGFGDLYVYGDPCQWETTKPDAPVTTVEEAVAALSSQASRDASAPVDITVGGYTGKSLTLRVPDDAVFSDCDQGEFRTLIQGQDGARYAQDPGQIDKLWILDVCGDLVIFDTGYYLGTPQSVVDELDAIVESATINHPSECP